MLESAIKYRKAFEYLKTTDHAYKYCPSVDEWGRAEKICEFLYPFYETTNLISGTSYPTSNLYFLQVYHIQCVLMGSLRSEDELIRSMGEKMMNKFKKYWEKYSIILVFGAILDPRLKISTLELMYEEIDVETAKGKVEHVKKKLYKLFEKYDKNSLPTVQAQGPSNQSSSMTHTPESASKKRLAIVGKLMKRNHQAEVSSGKNPLDTYLEEPLLSKDCFEDLDVLEWWKLYESRYPKLSIMAHDLLSILITKVASESAFSIGAHLINKYRSRMLPENVEAVICTRNWNKGFVDGEGEGEYVNPQGARQGGVSTSGSDSNFVDLESGPDDHVLGKVNVTRVWQYRDTKPCDTQESIERFHYKVRGSQSGTSTDNCVVHHDTTVKRWMGHSFYFLFGCESVFHSWGLFPAMSSSMWSHWCQLTRYTRRSTVQFRRQLNYMGDNDFIWRGCIWQWWFQMISS
ncbi:zinc finger BED domain-containing protein RICESLEEPER 1-like [Arachis stenosperma]|uniref:zinc finger BED domain-containing protein RICESLEEPER 1-like n=1 Tax=Arachis stenosperma TaxID=217475 RepID=UPI0025AC9AA5|nr:zinc finger BED domain-containing protein RICESLEEPER 1-like [Arachis stenosperma]